MENFPAFLPYVVLAFCAVLVLVGLGKGFSRGIARQTLRTLTVVVAFLICLYGVKALSPWLASQIEGVTVGEFLARYPAVQGTFWAIVPEPYCSSLLALDAECAECVLAIPVATVLIPFLFVSVFILLSGLLLIVHGILSLLLGLKKKGRKLTSRVLGMVLGALQGAFVAVIVLTPIVGLLNLSGAAVDSLAAECAEKPEKTSTGAVIDFYETNLRPTQQSQVVATISQYGGNALYSTFTTLTIGGDEIDLQEETKTFLYVISDLSGVVGKDLSNLTDDVKANVTSAVNRLTDPYFGRIISGVFRGVAQAADDGVIQLPAEEPYLGVVKDIVALLKESDETTVRTDLTTITQVWFLLSDKGVLVAMSQGSDEATNMLVAKDADGKTVVDLLLTILNGNERTKRLVVSLTKFSVSLMANQMGITGETAALYDNVKDGVNDVLKIDKNDYATEEEYVDAVADALDQTMKDNGIELDPEIVDTMADYIAENYSDIGEITDEEINDVLLSYYDAYVKSQESAE